MEFEQIAIVPLRDKFYAILRPVGNFEEIEPDEAIVFAVEEMDGEEYLIIEENDSIVDEVFECFYEMLRAEGIDVD